MAPFLNPQGFGLLWITLVRLCRQTKSESMSETQRGFYQRLKNEWMKYCISVWNSFCFGWFFLTLLEFKLWLKCCLKLNCLFWGWNICFSLSINHILLLNCFHCTELNKPVLLFYQAFILKLILFWRTLDVDGLRTEVVCGGKTLVWKIHNKTIIIVGFWVWPGFFHIKSTYSTHSTFKFL